MNSKSGSRVDKYLEALKNHRIISVIIAFGIIITNILMFITPLNSLIGFISPPQQEQEIKIQMDLVSAVSGKEMPPARWHIINDKRNQYEAWKPPSSGYVIILSLRNEGTVAADDVEVNVGLKTPTYMLMITRIYPRPDGDKYKVMRKDDDNVGISLKHIAPSGTEEFWLEYYYNERMIKPADASKPLVIPDGLSVTVSYISKTRGLLSSQANKDLMID